MITRFVVLAVVNEPYVVEDRANLFTPLQKLVSDNNVVEAVESVPVIVTGDEPSTVNPVHDTEPEHDAEVVAVVFTIPLVPVYASPCDRVGSLNVPENVLVPENVFESVSNVLDANVHVDVENE